MRALLSVMPFSGHVHPLAGLAEAWLAAGHELTVYAGAAFAHRFPGARFVPWREATDFDERRLEATFPAIGRPGRLGMMTNVREVFIGTAAGQARDLIGELGAADYDVLIGDVMSLGTGFAAHLTGLPWAAVSIVPLSLHGRGLPPPGLGLTPGRGRLGAVRDATLRGLVRTGSIPLNRALTRARREVGLPRGGPLDRAWYSPELTLLTGCPPLDHHRRDLPSSFHYVGRLPGPAGTHPPVVPPDRGRPLVLVTQGTYNTAPDELIHPAARALAGAEIDVVITTGRPGHRTLEVPIGDNTTVVDFADFDTLLPRCDAVVTNAGWGGTLHALSFGVPVVLAGSSLDKPEIAARVAATGAGVDLKAGTPTPEAIATAVDRVVREPSYRRMSQSLAPQLTDGRSRAVALISEAGARRW